MVARLVTDRGVQIRILAAAPNLKELQGNVRCGEMKRNSSQRGGIILNNQEIKKFKDMYHNGATIREIELEFLVCSTTVDKWIKKFQAKRNPTSRLAKRVLKPFLANEKLVKSFKDKVINHYYSVKELQEEFNISQTIVNKLKNQLNLNRKTLDEINNNKIGNQYGDFIFIDWYREKRHDISNPYVWYILKCIKCGNIRKLRYLDGVRDRQYSQRSYPERKRRYARRTCAYCTPRRPSKDGYVYVALQSKYARWNYPDIIDAYIHEYMVARGNKRDKSIGEHILVYAKKIGRPVFSRKHGVEIHHIDLNRANNNPNNLSIKMVRSGERHDSGSGPEEMIEFLETYCNKKVIDNGDKS